MPREDQRGACAAEDVVGRTLTLLQLKDPSGFEILSAVLDEDQSTLVLQKIDELFKQRAGKDFGLATSQNPADQAAARAQAKAWVEKSGKNARWRRDKKRFE